MPFAFPSCHCEEALAEADVAIQSESWWVLPVVPVERERGFFSTFLSLRAHQGVAIHAFRFFSLSLRGGSRRGRRGNPARVVVGAVRGSAGLPRRLRSSQ
jgi:hypothetical protein